MKNILIVYKNEWILNAVYETSDRIRGKVTDQTLFEERAIKRVGEYLLQNKENRRNKRYIIRIINEVAKSVVERNKNEQYTLLTELIYTNEDGEEVEFEPVDVLADVESEVLKKETIDLLAKGDRRKLKVLESWAVGNKNDKQISRTLASTFGGNPESHRKYIQRFRKDCHNILATAI